MYIYIYYIFLYGCCHIVLKKIHLIRIKLTDQLKAGRLICNKGIRKITFQITKNIHISNDILNNVTF